MIKLEDLHGKITTDVFPNLKEVVENFSKIDYREFIAVMSSNDVSDMGGGKQLIMIEKTKTLLVVNGTLALACSNTELKEAMGI